MSDAVASLQALSKPLVILTIISLLSFAFLPQIAGLLDNPFLIRVGMRIMIFAIAASSLNFILGYGGMVSLGHAAFMGIAAYVVAILNWHLSNGEPLLAWPIVVEGSANALIVVPAAIAASAVSALLIGVVSLRTSGLYFIMITLAFAQMLYYLFISFQKYGGEDGTQLLTPIALGSISLNNRLFLYYVIFAVLLAVLFLIERLVGSRYGLVL